MQGNVNVELISDQVLLPRFDCPDNLSPEDYLKRLVWEGVEEKYADITTEITDRVNYELEIINKNAISHLFFNYI